MGKYELRIDEEGHTPPVLGMLPEFKAFRQDTGFTGILKKNLCGKGSDIERRTIIGEDVLGITKSGQLIRIRVLKDKMMFEW